MASPQSADVVAADSLDYSHKIRSGSTYIMKNIAPSEGVWATWALQSTSENVIKLPPVVMNLSKSVLAGVINITAASAGANVLMKLHNGFIPHISAVSLTADSNQANVLADIKNVPQFTKILLPATTDMADFITNSSFYLAPPVAAGSAAAALAAAKTSPGQFFNKTNCSGRKLNYLVTAGLGVGSIPTGTNIPAGAAFTNPLATTAAVAITTGQVDLDADRLFAKGAFHFIADDCKTFAESVIPVVDWARCAGGSNPTVTTTNAEGFYFAYQLPLNMLRDSIFSCDKDLYFADTLLLKITWNMSVNVGYVHGQPAVTAQATTLIGGGKYAVTADTDIEGKFAGIANIAGGSPTLSDSKFWLAVVKDPIIAGAVKAQVQSQGMKLLVPFPVAKRVVWPTAGDNTAIWDISPAFGKNLLRVWSTIVTTTNSEQGAQVAHNVNDGGLHYTTLQTSLNTNLLQESPMTVAACEDYLFLRNLLDKSVIQHPSQYYSNAFWVDDWTGVKSIDFDEVNNVGCGVDLSAGPLQYQVRANTAVANLAIYMFAITQKVVSIGPEGLSVSSK